jgi:hypothetical protein
MISGGNLSLELNLLLIILCLIGRIDRKVKCWHFEEWKNILYRNY